MFAEKIGESSNTTGTGTFTLGGTYGNFRTWRSGFATGAVAFYLATNDTGSIWEIGYGTLTTGASDTLSRTLIASSSGALISWVTVPYRIFSIPAGVALAHLINGGLATSRPAWSQAGLGWLDYTIGIGTTWLKKRWTGAADIEEGRFDLTNGLYTPSPRNTWLDIGASGVAMLATHIGKVLLFDTTGGARTFTLLAGAAAGIGHGFTCSVLGYGGTAGVVLDPDGAEVIDGGTAGGNLTVPVNTLTRLSWDGAKSQWRTDLMSTANLPAGTIVQRTYDEYTTNGDLLAAIPGDDTIPLIGEGTEIFSRVITPLRPANRIRARVNVWGQCASASQYGIAALFRNGGANAIQVAAGLQNQLIGALPLEFEDSPGSGSAQTYSVNVGASSGAIRLNGTSAARLFGGASRCTMVLEEIQQ